MLEKKRGLILVISAPAGAGKTTLCKRLLQVSPSFTYSVSFTTRPPRKNEIEGVDYYFVSREEFEKMIEEEAFLEWAGVHGQLYGTSVKLLDRAIEGEKDVVLEVDVKGGKKIKKKYPEAILIFVVPPSWEELRERLKGRATEDAEKIKQRLIRAKKEVKFFRFYDYFIINDGINKALQDLLAIINAERCRVNRISKISYKKINHQEH
ncbi:guanylate kinase [Patescibacteria group bacterium]|nr:guanylate kinase [Patescibacteria group bacterium]